MTNLETIVQQLTYVAKTPDKQFREALLSGRKVIGCFPVYTPEPLAYAAGFLPMGLWGGGVTPFQAKRYVPAFCCPVMQADLEYGIQGTYEGMSAVMIPTLCDTFRCITQNWKVSVPGVEMLAVTYPQTRDAAGEEFLCSELVQIRGALERLSGKKITEEALADAIEIYNEHSVAMMRFAEVANEHLDVIRPQVRHAVMKSAWFMDKKAHTALVQTLTAELRKRPVYRGTEKKVLLTGIMAEPMELHRILEENGLSVVEDDLGQETRQYRTAIPDGADGLHRLAAQWSRIDCSLAHSSHKDRIRLLRRRAGELRVDGVIFCMMKFCDPEEYDYPLIADAMREMGIPTLFQEIDLQAGSLEQARTRIQALSEVL